MAWTHFKQKFLMYVVCHRVRRLSTISPNIIWRKYGAVLPISRIFSPQETV
ncbi:unnamed protein product [Acanthoscelides obtectus]|uniref:Uncharacterized protein n=1 Tax=Acanthoscelides obtectus TaxID=200917 RepID=A0A9P0JSA5_ACAOB|nr:unnamed protein product [Acanthoscelides obtectus]CAK1679243.1 hypothetical protein AOBTE_LOCUS32185 [Acanthoscelides obtectus]